jgi:hypothetical protein
MNSMLDNIDQWRDRRYVMSRLPAVLLAFETRLTRLAGMRPHAWDTFHQPPRAVSYTDPLSKGPRNLSGSMIAPASGPARQLCLDRSSAAEVEEEPQRPHANASYASCHP